MEPLFPVPVIATPFFFHCQVVVLDALPMVPEKVTDEPAHIVVALALMLIVQAFTLLAIPLTRNSIAKIKKGLLAIFLICIPD